MLNSWPKSYISLTGCNSKSPLATTSRKPSETGLSPSTKIGVGLGVPLGIIVAAFIVFLLNRYGRNVAQSWGRHMGYTAAQGSYPTHPDEGELQDEKGGTAGTGVVPAWDRRPELHGEHLPPTAKELDGEEHPTKKGFPSL